jgi:mannose-6-phosphate isomerase-like protein (cupin superfamily)
MDGLTHYDKDERPWGEFERFTMNELSTVKLITVKSKQELSLQTHEHRDEFWRVISGSGTVRIGERTADARPHDTFFVPRKTEHRVAAGDEGLVFLEIAFGAFNENDIHRIADNYGRA